VSNAGKVFAVAILVALAWAVAPAAEAQPPIRIGATLSQTGVYAENAQGQLRGYQLCVKHLNDKGGGLGRKLELVPYDDGSDPATAVRLYEKLINQDKVDLVLGPFGSIDDHRSRGRRDREAQDADDGIRPQPVDLQEGAEVRVHGESTRGGVV